MSTKKTFRRAFKPRGFSLLELLLVLSLAPIIFFAVYSNFSAGVRLWQRLQVSTPEEDRAIFRLKSQRDFKNAIRFASSPFLGESEEVVFMSSIDSEDGEAARSFGQVRYFYDDSAKAIARETRDLSQMYRDVPGRVNLLQRGVGTLVFSYLIKEPNETKPDWRDSFKAEKPGDVPLAVRLSYSVQGSTESIEQTYLIPAGGATK